MNWKLTYLFSPIALFVLVFQIHGQNNFLEGIEAYNQKQYNLAAENFEEVVKVDENNVAAWYNLGLSNIGKKAYGEAIYNFEKVLKYTPNDGEAEAKIIYCFGEIQPQMEWSPRLNSLQSSLYSLSLNAWGIICIAMSFAFAVGIVIYLQQKKSSLKSAFLFINIFLLGGFISSLIICVNVQSYVSNDSFAIVTSKSIPTFIENSPSPKTTIPEGVRVEVTQKMESNFVEVKTMTGETHIVRANDLRFI